MVGYLFSITIEDKNTIFYALFQILDFQENTQHITYGMNLIFYINLIFLFVISYSCCSSDKSRECKKTNDSALSLVQDSILIKPTTLKENAALIDAIIDSLIVIDDLQYELSIAIIKVSSIGAIDNFAEVGQRMTVKPNYVLDDSHKIDLLNERNKRLLKIKALKAGGIIKGKITLTKAGEWLLADVLE
ncbi:MAG: hypothetical protein QME52_03970 [Bacteroidota bacterium]|nr:hypothetical protein [Bacteroidota bacterium]